MTQKKAKKTNQKDNKKGLKVIALLIVLILIIIIFLNFRTDGAARYSKTQIILDNANITDQLQDDVLINDDKIYMSIDDVKKILDETIYKEEETGLIITASDLKIATLNEENENAVTINGSNQNIEKAIIKENEKDYILISELENVYNYELQYISDTNVITIDRLNKECIKAKVKKKTKIKQENKFFSKSAEKIEKETEVIVISQEKDVAKIRTPKGNIGYIKSKLLEDFVTVRENMEEISNKEIGENAYIYDITSKDITTFKKREEVINLILQETIKNDKMEVKIIYNGEDNIYFERFKIEAIPILRECGITVGI